MPNRKLQKETLIVCRLLVSIVRTTAAIFEDGHTFSHTVPDVLLCAAIFIGEAEGRPMTAGKVATYIGMPRPTVLRRITALIDLGHVSRDPDGTLRMIRNTGNIVRERAATVENLQHINRAVLALSKMDIQAIARQPELGIHNANDVQTGNDKSSQ